MNWLTMTLGDGLEVLIDNRGKNPAFSERGIPAISGMYVGDGVLYLSSARRVSEEVWDKWMPTKTKKHDVVLTSEAPLGRVALVPSNEPLTLTQRVFGLRGRHGVLDSRFLFYAFQTSQVQADLQGRATGTTVLGIRQPALLKVQIPAPPYEEQQAIAEVLGALDDKIAANTKIIALLDTHMALEYTAAVDIEPESSPLAAVAKFHNRLRVPLSAREREQRQGNIPYYGASGIFGSVDEAIFNEALVLVGEDGSVIKADGTPVIQYIWGPAWVNNHAHVLTGIGLSTEVLYLAIARSQVANLVTGAVQPKINMGNLKSLMLELPAEASRMRLESIVGAETASKRALTDEIKTLAATRDALLPQLMSGKLRVKDAEKVLEDVGV